MKDRWFSKSIEYPCRLTIIFIGRYRARWISTRIGKIQGEGKRFVARVRVGREGGGRGGKNSVRPIKGEKNVSRLWEWKLPRSFLYRNKTLCTSYKYLSSSKTERLFRLSFLWIRKQEKSKEKESGWEGEREKKIFQCFERGKTGKEDEEERKKNHIVYLSFFVLFRTFIKYTESADRGPLNKLKEWFLHVHMRIWDYR